MIADIQATPIRAVFLRRTTNGRSEFAVRVGTVWVRVVYDKRSHKIRTALDLKQSHRFKIAEWQRRNFKYDKHNGNGYLSDP